MNSLKINMFTRNAYFQYSHRAVSVITAFTLVFSSFVFALPSLAHADTTVTLYPVSNGTYSQWENDWNEVEETSSFSCSSGDYIREDDNGDKESFNIDLSGIPNGSLITSIDVLTYSRDEDSGDTGTYRALVILNGDESESSGSPISPSSDSGCDGPNTKTFDVSDTVKSGATSLQVGVKKSNSSDEVRVGAIHAVITYTVAEDIACDTVLTYEKTGNFSDGAVSINFESGDDQIDVSAQPGYQVTEVWLDVDGDGHGGYWQYASGPVNNFNPNPGNDIDEAKVVVKKICVPDAELTINKVIINDDGGTVVDEEDFSFSINGGGAVAFEADGSNTITMEDGAYTVEESPTPAGYTVSYEGDCVASIVAGESKTCTIINNDISDPDSQTIVVSADTSAGENLLGWMFNRDTSTETPFTFNAGAASVGTGSLFVPPITNTVDGNSDKFIGELFLLTDISEIDGISYDFRIDAPDATVEERFYMNVYANFGESSPTKFYDCRYDVIPSTGSTGAFTTVSFDPSQSYTVTTRAGGDPSPYSCPASPADMDTLSPGSSIRVIALNVGDTSGSDTGVSGYLDKVVVSADTMITTYDFEPVGDETAPNMPVHLWPEDGAVMPSSFLTHIDWTDVTDVSEPVVYYYESAFSSATSTGTYGDDFTSPIYQSGTLAVSEIPTLGTGEGTYFWHVRAVDDEGNSTPWTAPWSVIVDNTPPDVTVTIVKYIDDEHATAESVDSASFPMYAIYPGGEGNYSLTTSGFNNPNPYEATTSNMPWGSDYSTYEVTSAEGPVYPIGEDCPIDSYRLVGYKTGNTLEQAEADDISTDVPVFEGLMTSKYVIVVNEPCTLGTSEIIQPTESEETSGTTELEAYYADENGDGNDGVQWAVRAGTCAANTGTVFGNVDGKNTPFTWDGTNFNTTIDTTQVLNGSYCFVFNPTEDGGNTNQRLTRLFSINNPLPDVKVHIYKYLQGDETTEQVPDDFEPATTFPMQSSWDAENIGAGSGAYVLGNNHGGAAFKYAADTSAMTSGADYSTYEDTYPGNGSSNVLAPTESCQVGYYKLVGYQSSTTSLEDAEEASISTVAPSFTGLESDAYVIVVNKYCGDEPEVTYADEVKMCKVDQNGDELSGWTLYLKGDTVETLNVNSNSWMGADSSVLDDYTSYLAFASGTWANQGGANLVDAEYSTTDSWTSYMDGYTGYGNDILDLQLNEGFINWGSYNSDHSYVYGFTPIIDDSVNFRVFDGTGGVQNEGWFNDNSGSLSVEIAKGFIGETDEETGCVTFENVPYGSYTVGEILQDGWTNVTEEDGTVAVGDTVVVEGSEQVFTLMNDNGEEEPVYGSITIVKSTGEDGDGTFTFTSEELGVEGEFTITTEVGIGQETFTNLLAGTYTVDELVPEGWNLDDAFCDDDDSGIPSIVLSEGENVTCTFENSVEEVEEGGGDDGPPVETFSTFGGGNGPVVGSFGAVLGASTGQVLGASTGGLPELPNGCSALVSTYMRRGMNNDPEQVKLLQSFLNGEMGLSLPLTGFFGLLTENAVKAFQLKYAEQILAPWGITQPTGYVYKTTQRWINLSHCSSLNIPMPDLSN